MPVSFRSPGRFFVFVLAFLSLALSQQAIASCSQFEAEAEAFEGVVPRFNEDGSLKALLMYGEATFLVPKRSLISTARREAEMQARRAYSEFIQSNFSAETELKNIQQEYSKTDSQGMTQGQVEELKGSLQLMKSNTSTVQSGIIKLDECVDTEGKYMLVALGWKPRLSAAAADVNSTVLGEITRGIKPKPAQKPSSKQVSNKGGSATVGVNYVTVEVSGSGSNKDAATRDALRIAVSQVHGAEFASKSGVTSQISSATTDTDGASNYQVSENSVSVDASMLETSGLIKSWSYVSTDDASDDGLTVTISVTMPTYGDSLNRQLPTVVIVDPVVEVTSGQNDAGNIKVFVSGLYKQLEVSIANTNAFNLLSRKNASAVSAELALIARSGNKDEMVRIGKQAGADYLIIPRIDQFSAEIDRREVGDRVFERTVFNALFTTSVIEVATSNSFNVQRYPFKNRKLRSADATGDFSSQVAGKMATHIAGLFGGKVQAGAASSGLLSEADLDKLREKKNEELKKLKEKHADDW